MKNNWSKLVLSFALAGSSLSLSAGIVDKIEHYLGLSNNPDAARTIEGLKGLANKPGAAEAIEELKRQFSGDRRRHHNPQLRIAHWKEVVSSFRKCGPGNKSEAMGWAERNLARAERDARNPRRTRTRNR